MYASITIVTSRQPRSLLRKLRDDARLTVDAVEKGILPKALSERENLWIGSLRQNLSKNSIEKLVSESKQSSGLGGLQNLKAYKDLRGFFTQDKAR